MPRLTRRQSIAAVAGGGVAVGLGGLGLLSSREGDLVDSILRRVVGPYRMKDEEFTRFVADLGTAPGYGGRAKVSMFRAVAATDPDTVLRIAPSAFGRKYEDYERRVVTGFLTRTDFLAVGPQQPATFIGEPGCRNPFARFDMT